MYPMYKIPTIIMVVSNKRDIDSFFDTLLLPEVTDPDDLYYIKLVLYQKSKSMFNDAKSGLGSNVVSSFLKCTTFQTNLQLVYIANS